MQTITFRAEDIDPPTATAPSGPVTFRAEDIDRPPDFTTTNEPPSPSLLRQAGEAGMAKIQGGDPRLAAAFGAATPALGAVVEALPTKLKEQASKQVVQALGPTKERVKAIAENLAPNILQRGLRGSREALQDQAATTLSQVGDQLDTLLTQRGQQVISPQPVIQ